MVLRTLVTCCVLVLVLVSSAAAAYGTIPIGHPGPHSGIAVEGATNTHHYATDVLGNPCIPMIAQFIVTLTHEPAADTLLLEVRDHAAESVGGQARVEFYASWCTTFEIDVTGIDVPDVDFYTVVVERVGGA